MKRNDETASLLANTTGRLVDLILAHPYLTSLAACLLVHFFTFGGLEHVPNNAALIEAAAIFAGVSVVLYKRKNQSQYGNIVFVLELLIFAGVLIITTYCFTKSETKPIWYMAGGCFLLELFYIIIPPGEYIPRLKSALIIAVGFCLKICYVLGSNIFTRQNDVHTFEGGNGHAGYIQYLLDYHHLPDYDVRDTWQFCHPPLHHIISAIWIYLNDTVFGTGINPARESLQILTLFYTCCIIISAYKILRFFKLEGLALYVPLVIISFHPAFILFSGAINNDCLSVTLMLGAFVCALKWYREQTFKNILQTALCFGLAMMTKLSAGIAAPAIAVIFLTVFFKKIKTDGKRIFGQFAAFMAVCAPLGLWFEIKNYIKYKIPINYVQEMDVRATQYIGDQDFASRITDFSSKQIESVFEQWLSYDENGNAVGYNEYNPLITLLKNSLFGESINDSTFENVPFAISCCKVLFGLAVVIAAVAFVCMIVSFVVRPKSEDCTIKVSLLVFYVTMMVSFYKLAHDYAFTCTMNFRYITPTVITGSIFLGIIMNRKGKPAAVLSKVIGVASVLFAILVMCIYLTVCTPAVE